MAKNFSIMPTISINRSRFVRNSQHKTSIKLGELVPIYCDEVLPGDSRNFSIAEFIRMTNLIAPLMDNIYCDVYAFFVPNRLTWESWKQFMGENNTSAGIYTGTEYTIPSTTLTSVGVGSIGDYLGLPVSVTNGNLKVSSLPGRAYNLIYNEWFRDQNVEAPVTTALDSNTAYNYAATPFVAYKKSDYFTRALPYAQKGAPVSIPLGSYAPVTTTDVKIGSALVGEDYLLWKSKDDSDTFDAANATLIGSPLNGSEYGAMQNKYLKTQDDAIEVDLVPANLVADLSQATAATINQLRFAFQYQKLLEKDSLYGTRYWEILKGHFGITAPDASLQRPELLGHQKININIDQVIQTTGIDQATPASNELGQTAGISVTGASAHLFNKSFTEHGHLMVLCVFRHDESYAQGINRMFTRKVRSDFYFPEFANLGAQPVYDKEIYVNSSTKDQDIFGYQEAWAEYRYKPNQVSGLLNPAAANSLGYYTLANNFSAKPTLSTSFLKVDRTNLLRCTSASTTDFICDFAFKDIAVRPMPVYSVPGLIDHH